ncbi:MAG: hypothetical protein GX621_08105, partial [Pirellulaceae bacterium]|nr:hypothetical protein [Pirellulaceae bacterium]
MNAILFGWLWVLGRTTLLVALSALIVAAVLRLARPKAPRVHRAAWCMALLVGWFFIPLSVEVPWYDPAVSQNVAQPPSAVEDTPHNLQQPRAVVLHDAQQPGAVVLHEGTIELAEGGMGEPSPVDLSDVPSPIAEESMPLVAVAPPVLANRPSSPLTPPLAAANQPSRARDIFSRVSWQGILFSLWLAGMVVVVLRWLAGYIRSLRAMSTALRPDEASCRQWRELLAGQGVKREIPLRLTEGMGPLLCR